jgi:hypothetical protein
MWRMDLPKQFIHDLTVTPSPTSRHFSASHSKGVFSIITKITGFHEALACFVDILRQI